MKRKGESVTCAMPSSLLSFHSLNEQRSAVINGRPRGGRGRRRERRREAECMQMCVRESDWRCEGLHVTPFCSKCHAGCH